MFLASCTFIHSFMPAYSWLHVRWFLASCQLVPGFMPACSWLHALLFLASCQLVPGFMPVFLASCQFFWLHASLFLASCQLVPGFMHFYSWLHASLFLASCQFFWLHASLFLASCQLVPGFMPACSWLHALLFLASCTLAGETRSLYSIAKGTAGGVDEIICLGDRNDFHVAQHIRYCQHLALPPRMAVWIRFYWDWTWDDFFLCLRCFILNSLLESAVSCWAARPTLQHYHRTVSFANKARQDPACLRQRRVV